jgi:hypothetical protein
MGMARTFQNIRLFSELSVLDNVKIAFNMHVKYNLAEAVVRDKLYFSEEDYVAEKPWNCWKFSIWKNMRTILPRTCLTANNAAWKLPGPWLPSPSCYYWMNRLPA